MGWQTVLQNYLTAAASVSRTMRISYVAAWRILLSARLRHEIGPFYFCLFSLDGKAPNNLSEYLTNYEIEPIQRRWNPKHMHALVRDKVRFQDRCEAAGLAVPRVIAIVGHGINRDWQMVQESAALARVLTSCEYTHFFFKHASGAHGHGAFVVEHVGKEYRFAGYSGNADDLFRYIISMLPPGERYLVQPRLRNHPNLQPIMSASGLGTVRIVTCLLRGKASIVTACLRITVGPNVTDNFSVGSAGNLAASIDVDSGRLSVAVGSVRKEWPEMFSVDTHPDTGVRISGRVVPDWQVVKTLAQGAHEAFPELGVIGWDIAVTEQGPLLIEANHAWDINLLQVAHCRGMRGDMQAVMGEF